MSNRKLIVTTLSAIAIMSACTLNTALAKDSYSFYLSKDNSFSQKNGTLDHQGYLKATFNGEKFTGRNANNVIEAKGDKGHKMTCRYEMPDETGKGSCEVSDGTVLKMKFE